MKECIDCGKPASRYGKNGWAYCEQCLSMQPPKSCANGACPACCKCGDCVTYLAGEPEETRWNCTCKSQMRPGVSGTGGGMSFESINKLAEAIDSDNPMAVINESRLTDLVECYETESKKSAKGAHGGGNAYEQFSMEREFTDHTKKALKSKDKPNKPTENKLDPGEGETGEKPNKVTPPKGFTQSKEGLPKDKDKPGKVTKNTMPGEAMERTLDAILEEFPSGIFGGDEPSFLNEPQAPTDEFGGEPEDEFMGEPSPVSEPKALSQDIISKLNPEVVALLPHLFGGAQGGDELQQNLQDRVPTQQPNAVPSTPDFEKNTDMLKARSQRRAPNDTLTQLDPEIQALLGGIEPV